MINLKMIEVILCSDVTALFTSILIDRTFLAEKLHYGYLVLKA